MSDIGPGDWVECVDDAPGYGNNAPSQMSVGGLYFVEGAYLTTRGCNKLGCTYKVALKIKGISINKGMCPHRFRPIRADEEKITKKESLRVLV